MYSALGLELMRDKHHMNLAIYQHTLYYSDIREAARNHPLILGAHYPWERHFWQKQQLR